MHWKHNESIHAKKAKLLIYHARFARISPFLPAASEVCCHWGQNSTFCSSNQQGTGWILRKGWVGVLYHMLDILIFTWQKRVLIGLESRRENSVHWNLYKRVSMDRINLSERNKAVFGYSLHVMDPGKWEHGESFPDTDWGMSKVTRAQIPLLTQTCG